MPIVIFLIGIAARTTSPLSSPHAPMDHVFLTGTVPPIIGRPLPSQPQRIAQGCFYSAQARHGAGQFFKMSRSMRSRSFSRCKRAISAAWSADGSGAAPYRDSVRSP